MVRFLLFILRPFTCTVKLWESPFKEDTSVVKIMSGRPFIEDDASNIARVEALVLSDGNITVEEITVVEDSLH